MLVVSLLGICVRKNPKNRLTFWKTDFLQFGLMLFEGSLLSVGGLHYCSPHAEVSLDGFDRFLIQGMFAGAYGSIPAIDRCLD